MKTITSTETVEGKTVLSVYHQYSDLVIRFTDGTFIAFRSELGYENETSIEINERIENYTLSDAGVISHAEYVELKRREAQSAKDQQEARERELFEELKKKYEEG